MANIVVGGERPRLGQDRAGLRIDRCPARFSLDGGQGHDPRARHSKPICEETAAGTATDTARYLAAGAGSALLVTAQPKEIEQIVRGLLHEGGPEPHLIFESNSILRYLKADLCLAIDGSAAFEPKPSFRLAAAQADAIVAHADTNSMVVAHSGSPTLFHLGDFGHISLEMLDWTRAHGARWRRHARTQAALSTDHSP
jgi:hypothetical protein